MPKVTQQVPKLESRSIDSLFSAPSTQLCCQGKQGWHSFLGGGVAGNLEYTISNLIIWAPQLGSDAFKT